MRNESSSKNIKGLSYSEQTLDLLSMNWMAWM